MPATGSIASCGRQTAKQFVQIVRRFDLFAGQWTRVAVDSIEKFNRAELVSNWVVVSAAPCFTRTARQWQMTLIIDGWTEWSSQPFRDQHAATIDSHSRHYCLHVSTRHTFIIKFYLLAGFGESGTSAAANEWARLKTHKAETHSYWRDQRRKSRKLFKVFDWRLSSLREVGKDAPETRGSVGCLARQTFLGQPLPVRCKLVPFTSDADKEFNLCCSCWSTRLVIIA